MRHYIGIDLSKEVSAISVKKEDGTTLIDGMLIRTEADTIKAFIEGIPRPREVTFEENVQAAWIHSILEPICDHVLVCNPLKNRQLSGEKKSDKKDAHNLCERLRAGLLVPVWHGGENIQKLRELAKAYITLTKDSTRYILRVDSIFRSRGLKRSSELLHPETRDAKLLELPLKEQQGRARLYLETLDLVTKNRERAEQVLIAAAKKSKMYKPLTSIPKIGPISAALFIAMVGSPQRFRTKRQFWSYIGLSVSTFETAQYEAKNGRIKLKPRNLQTRGLVKQYNRVLKYIIKSAATKLAHAEWNAQFIKLVQSGISSNNAKLTLTRKLAAIMLHLAKTGESYNEVLVLNTNKH